MGSDERHGARKGNKVRLSNLYSYCVRPTSDEGDGRVPLGGPGFSRVVFCNESSRHRAKPFKYPSNYVSTTKYNLFTFIPKAVFEQFRRVANLYFLVTAALSLTPLTPFTAGSLIAPLVFVIGVSMLKEAIEDWRRFLQDREVNTRIVKAFDNNRGFVDTEWQNVRVGDVVRIQKDEFFPADLLFLSSSYPDGICYVETMNLDGETNLKLKKADESTTRELDQEEAFHKFKGTIKCEDPNASLYSFIGNLEYENAVISLGPQHILLRDSKLRNTQYVYGVVIFSGHDTKVMKNATDPPSKRSRIERKMDSIIYVLFTVLVTISVIGAVIFGIRTKNDMPHWWYLRPDDADSYFNPENPVLAGFLQFVTAVILYGYLIPISLYVSIEIVKVLQAMFINQDIHMYYEELDKPAHARTSNLNEELGQVDTILSDKTGTLTCNQMDFIKCSIAGISYGVGVSEIERATAERMQRNSEDIQDLPSQCGNGHIQVDRDGDIEMMETPHIKGFNFVDARLMNGAWVTQKQPELIRMFFRILAICHTAIPEKDDAGCIQYEAESPDEGAFVIAAREFGFEFSKRTQTSVHVRESDPSLGIQEREYKLLNLLEFNSTRKRMSVVVQDEDGQFFVFCKGADSVILERLSKNGREFEEATKTHLANYGDAGLRTLALAYRKLDESTYKEWNEVFVKAKTTVGADRDSMLDEASEMIEKDLILVGATAVEDKLQAGVPECIDKLALAGLKIWVLTGDKLETAINIGFACSLLRQDMKQIIITLDTQEIKIAEESNDKNALVDLCRRSVSNQLVHGQQQATLDTEHDITFALIIDGKALGYALEDDMQNTFLQLATNCASVICCRVSPKQKALVTKLVKQVKGKTTLAVGDGANDVGMIQEADIGVGISGVEGMQAVMASDFSIAQFRFLERLLIVHGHWCYKRIATMVCYFFYKNILFGLTLFYFQAYSNFSGQTLYNDWYNSLFNVFFTSLPVLALGVFEQDVAAEICLQFPALYQQGPKNMFFNWVRILTWMVNGIIGSVVVFFFTIRIFRYQAFRQSGQVAGFEALGATMYSTIIWVVNCQIALATSHFTWIQHVAIWGSIALWYIFLLVYGVITPTISTTAYYILIEAIGPSSLYWFSTVVVVFACIFPYCVFSVLQRRFRPQDHHIIQEIKFLQKDKHDPEMWSEEREKAVEKSKFGITAKFKFGYKKRRRNSRKLVQTERSL